MSDLFVVWTEEEKTVRFAVIGQLIVSNRQTFLQLVEEALERVVTEWPGETWRFVVNLEHASYVDSSGLGVMMKLKRLVEGKGHSIRAENAPKAILNLFKLTKLDTVFEVSGQLITETQEVQSGSS